jgi:acyl-CoA thioester hydrolase
MSKRTKHQSFKKEVRVRYAHTDSIGVTFFANYLVFFDDVLIEFFRDGGFTFTPQGENVVNGKTYADECWVIGEVRCKYYIPSTYDDILEISVKLKELEDKQVVFELTCYNKTTNALCAEGRMIFIYFDKKKGHSMKIPDEIIEMLK